GFRQAQEFAFSPARGERVDAVPTAYPSPSSFRRTPKSILVKRHSGCPLSPSPLWGGWRQPGGGRPQAERALLPHPTPSGPPSPQGGGRTAVTHPQRTYPRPSIASYSSPKIGRASCRE